MSAIVTLLGIALGTAAAVVLISVVNGQLTTNWSSQLNGNNSNGEWIDPDGPSVQFILFTNNYPSVNLKIGNNNRFLDSGFNISNPTKIIIHGFLSSIKEDVFVVNQKAYLETGDFNVIGMDWSVLCDFEYLSAMRGVRTAGRYLAEFINWLRQMGVPLESIHVIGHSMGAHVAGIGGGNVKGGKVARITGLDPAKPGYGDMRFENKLDSGDAALVDVIHTYMRVLSLPQAIGHVDFYPNGGKLQPGCPDMMEDIWAVKESLLCNHGRAYYLFAESVRNENAFKSKKCKSVDDAFHGRCTEDTDVHMGQSETYVNGIYYLQTREASPYSLE